MEHVPVEKIKLLHNKKPVPDSKVLKDLIVVDDDKDSSCVETEKTVELSVMVLGGMASTRVDITEKTTEATNAEAMDSCSMPKLSDIKEDILKSEGFWLDFKKFLDDRLDDTFEKQRITDLFRKAVTGKESEKNQ